MLRNRFLGESSWLALRGPDDEGAGGGDNGGGSGGDAGGDDQGGQQGDKGGGQADDGGAAAEGDQNKPGAKDDGAAAERQDSGTDGGAGAGEGGRDGGAGSEDWRDKELARRARRVREEAARAAEVAAENQRLRELMDRMAGGGDGGGSADDQGGGRSFTQEDVRREAERIANEKIAAERARLATEDFNNRCNTAAYKARAEYGQTEFDTAVQRLVDLGFYGDDQKNMENIHLALETDDPGAVLFELGKNPNELHRVMSLPPLRRHTEFVKIAEKAAAKRAGGGQQQKRPSGASPPVEPIGGRGGDTDNRYSENVPSADWHAQEEKREREYWARKNAAFRGA